MRFARPPAARVSRLPAYFGLVLRGDLSRKSRNRPVDTELGLRSTNRAGTFYRQRLNQGRWREAICPLVHAAVGKFCTCRIQLPRLNSRLLGVFAWAMVQSNDLKRPESSERKRVSRQRRRGRNLFARGSDARRRKARGDAMSHERSGCCVPLLSNLFLTLADSNVRSTEPA